MQPVRVNHVALSSKHVPMYTCLMTYLLSFSNFYLAYDNAEAPRGAVVEWLEQLGYGAESRRIA